MRVREWGRISTSDTKGNMNKTLTYHVHENLCPSPIRDILISRVSRFSSFSVLNCHKLLNYLTVHKNLFLNPKSLMWLWLFIPPEGLDLHPILSSRLARAHSLWHIFQPYFLNSVILITPFIDHLSITVCIWMQIEILYW